LVPGTAPKRDQNGSPDGGDMADLIEISSRIIDSGHADQPVNRVTQELSEVADGLAVVESFSHCVALRTGDGLVCFDASGAFTGAAVVEALRTWSDERISHLVYTHGHADHVGGSGAFAADADRRGVPRPAVVGHRNVDVRFDRYDLTSSWNLVINARQFGGLANELNLGLGDGAADDAASDGASVSIPANVTARRFLPRATLRPDVVVADHHTLTVGDELIELHHARGETDDHLWAWMPERRWLASGDFVIWNFPNAGNPQKVQRYPVEWAAALRRMASMQPELLLPAHGLPIAGAERIGRVLDDIATALENLVRDVLQLMNEGATLDTIVHTVKVPDDTLAKPFMRPLYDEPEFVVRGIWRQFGGWWDGAASRLKPAPDAHLAREIASLAGGAEVLVRRAQQAASEGDLRLAGHLMDFAGWAAPDDAEVHAARAEFYRARRKAESSLMAKGIFLAAARESETISGPPADPGTGGSGR
jgi:alkyl sulfatase BDS1-like metallo-beta-lactamase superfamily hydrolase